MVTRDVFTGESLTEATYNTDTNYQTKLTYTFSSGSQKASTDYIVFFCAQIKINNGSGQVWMECRDGTGAVTLNEYKYSNKDNNDYIDVFWFDKWTSASSPANQDFVIRYKTTNTLYTASIKNARIIVMEMLSGDQYAEQDTVQSTSSTSVWTDALTLSFTPGATENYYILGATCLYAAGGSTNIADARLDVDGTAYTQSDYRNEASGVIRPYMVGTRQSLTSGASRSIKLQVISGTASNSASMDQIRLLAMPASNFDNDYYQEDRTESTYSTDTTLQTKSTLTQTPLNKKHIVFGGAQVRIAGTSQSWGYELSDGTTVFTSSRKENRTTSTTEYCSAFSMYMATLAASSTSWTNKYKTYTAGTVAGIDESFIMVLQAEGAGAAPPNAPAYVIWY